MNLLTTYQFEILEFTLARRDLTEPVCIRSGPESCGEVYACGPSDRLWLKDMNLELIGTVVVSGVTLDIAI